MSNGELGTPANPWTDISLSPATLMGAVGPEMAAVEDARGDVRAANERLRDDIIAAQERVRSAEADLTDTQQSVLEVLKGMRLMGRAVDFDSGTSLAVVYTRPPGKDIARLKEESLAGVSGELVSFEVGTLLGKPIKSKNTIVLHIDTSRSTRLQADRVAVAADEAEFTISEAPRPDDR